MSDSKFLQKGKNKQLAHLVEECGEVLAAAGKTQRWGWESTNPVTGDPETNAEWLWRELQDLKLVIRRLEKSMKSDFPNDNLD